MVGIDNARREKHDAKGMGGMRYEDGRGYSNDTRVYEICMQTIYEGKKIKEYATTKVPRATRSL